MATKRKAGRPAGAKNKNATAQKAEKMVNELLSDVVTDTLEKPPKAKSIDDVREQQGTEWLRMQVEELNTTVATLEQELVISKESYQKLYASHGGPGTAASPMNDSEIQNKVIELFRVFEDRYTGRFNGKRYDTVRMTDSANNGILDEFIKRFSFLKPKPQ